jgi:hypothetical protein
MYFDLASILRTDINLGDLERPFSKEEIDKIISALPNNKSLALMASMGNS